MARKDGVTVRLDSRSLTSLRSLGQWALALASQQVEVQGRSSTEFTALYLCRVHGASVHAPSQKSASTATIRTDVGGRTEFNLIVTKVEKKLC